MHTNNCLVLFWLYWEVFFFSLVEFVAHPIRISNSQCILIKNLLRDICLSNLLYFWFVYFDWFPNIPWHLQKVSLVSDLAWKILCKVEVSEQAFLLLWDFIPCDRIVSLKIEFSQRAVYQSASSLFYRNLINLEKIVNIENDVLAFTYFLITVKSKVQLIFKLFFTENHIKHKSIFSTWLKILHSDALLTIALHKSCKNHIILQWLTQFCCFILWKLYNYIKGRIFLLFLMVLVINWEVKVFERKTNVTKFFRVSCGFWKDINQIPEKAIVKSPFPHLIAQLFTCNVYIISFNKFTDFGFLLRVNLKC